MYHTGFMVDARQFPKSSLDLNGKLNIRLHQTVNDSNTWIGYIEESRRANDDDLGALYYVVAVIFIYGLSIVMMIASHIRKNKQDNQLRTYLKEMAKLRKDDRREKVFSKMNDITSRRQQDGIQNIRGSLKATPGDSEVCQPLMTKDNTNEDNLDSVFSQPDCCILDDYKYNTGSQRVRSLSCHDNVHRKNIRCDGSIGNNTVPNGNHDSKTVRIQEFTSTNCKDHRIIIPPLKARSSSVSNFPLSPLFGRGSPAAVHENSLNRWNKPRASLQNDHRYGCLRFNAGNTEDEDEEERHDVARFHRQSETKLPLNDVEKNLCRALHSTNIVAGDAVL